MGENIEKSEVKLTVGQRFLRLLLTLRRALIPIFVYLLWGMLFELLWALLLAVFVSAFPETAFLRFLQENEGLFLMLAISLPSFFVLYRMYRRDCFWFQADTGERKPVPCPGCLLLTALGAASGFNILLQLSPLIRMFPSIVEVNAELAGSSLLLSLCYTVLACRQQPAAVFVLYGAGGACGGGASVPGAFVPAAAGGTSLPAGSGGLGAFVRRHARQYGTVHLRLRGGAFAGLDL